MKRAEILLSLLLNKVYTSYKRNHEIVIDGLIKETKFSESFILYFIVDEQIFGCFPPVSKCNFFFYSATRSSLATNQYITKKNTKTIKTESCNFYMFWCKIAKSNILPHQNSKIQTVKFFIYGTIKKFSFTIVFDSAEAHVKEDFLPLGNFVFSTNLKIIDNFYVWCRNYDIVECFSENQMKLKKVEQSFRLEFIRKNIKDADAIESIFLIDDNLKLHELNWNRDCVLSLKSGVVSSTNSLLTYSAALSEKNKTMVYVGSEENQKNDENSTQAGDLEPLKYDFLVENTELENKNSVDATENDNKKKQIENLQKTENLEKMEFYIEYSLFSDYVCFTAFVFFAILSFVCHFYFNYEKIH